MTAPAATPVPAEGSDPRVLSEVRERIACRGPIPFAEFMEIALYHPAGGYYAREEHPIGREASADYYTAPSRHPSFGATVAEQVVECLDRVGDSPLDLVEFGPGDGSLLGPILARIRAARPDLAERIRLTLVEANRLRVEEQRRRIEAAGFAGPARWIRPGDWEASREQARGCLLANEVLDALPVHRLRFEKGELREIHVAWENGLREVSGPVSRPEILEELRRHECAPREGQEIEVGLAAVRFIREAARRVGRGYILLFDYGHTTPEIYSPRHHRGTLLAYHRHATSERYLERAGRQDLTAHVNFTSVLAAARQAGLEAAGPVSQARFLLSLGILGRLPAAGEAFRWDEFAERRAVRDLVMPGGMGETHQVLVLATPGVGIDLAGLRNPEAWAGPRPGGPVPPPADGER